MCTPNFLRLFVAIMATKRPYPASSGILETPPKKARKVLTLAEKVQVINEVKAGLSNRRAAAKFEVGRTQVNNIMLEEKTIMKAYMEGTNAKVKYLVPRTLKYGDIDEAVYNFFIECRSKNIPVTGAALQRHAHIVALRLDHDDFTASNGWLDSFTNRHQLKLANLHGEGAEVSEEACKQWLDELPNLLAEYDLDDIYNCDETGVSFRSIPTKSLIRADEKASGTKVLKERFTVLVTGSATGKKEKLWIIGKSKNPRSFPKNKSDYAHLFTYRSNKRAWMTSNIFMEYVNWFNNKMQVQGRKVLLMLDNCPAHPPVTLSNVKLLFLPKNTTSHLQPMDAGVIAWLKKRYTRLFLTDLVEAMSEAADVTALAKAITIWDAIINVKLAWDCLPSDCIENCFRRCGVTKDPVTPPTSPTPEDSTDEEEACFNQLAEVPLDEYLAYQNALEVSNPCTSPLDNAADESDHDNDIDDIAEEPEPEPTITGEEALKYLKKIQKYCFSNERNFNLSNQLICGIRSEVIKAQINQKSKQSTITNFFLKH